MKEIPISSMVNVTENYLKNKYPIFYSSIIKMSINDDVSLSERIWLYKNEIDKIPVCPNCKEKNLKYRNFTVGYRKFCSKKCSAEYSHKDLSIKEKRISKMRNCNYDIEMRESMTIKANETKKLFTDDKKNNIKEKRILSVNKKYGVDIISQNKDIIEKIKKNVTETKYKNRDINFSKRINKIGYELISCEKEDLKIKCTNCEHSFNIHRSLFNQRNRLGITICTECNPIDNHISDFQNKISVFISSIYDGEIINNKKIGKYEIDIFLPELNIGFECNGIWWHSELYREKEYHINKINYFKEKNIKIINIWEDWWKNKKDIVMSIISNKLNKTKTKIYARKTQIREITDEKIIRSFLNENHIQGYIQSNIKIGLFYKNEIVSLMIFGKRRIALGKKKTSDDDFELLRFCNKLDSIIIGGASKLFNHFTKNYNFSKITTYADLSISEGNLYKKLNMTYLSLTTPNYSYFHKDNGIRQNRFNFRKDILVKQGFDKTKTEHEIMKERKYYRIYDCGNLKFEYTKNPDV